MTATSLALVGLSVLVAGCAHYGGSDQRYAHWEARTAYDVVYGRVDAVREVEIGGYATVIGRWGGAQVGQALGSTVHRGSARRVSRAVAGVAAAVAGEALEREMTSERGVELTVLLDSGQLIAVVQADDVELAPGDPVRVLLGPEGGA
jgi:outer membrane lipoprotein SlyB